AYRNQPVHRTQRLLRRQITRTTPRHVPLEPPTAAEDDPAPKRVHAATTVTALTRMALSQDERRVILLSAGIAARRQDMREHAGGLMAEVDWSRLVETLRLRRLLPALGPRILELAEGQAS